MPHQHEYSAIASWLAALSCAARRTELANSYLLDVVLLEVGRGDAAVVASCPLGGTRLRRITAERNLR